MNRRVVSLWFPRLASDRFLRTHPINSPFALTRRQNNTERLYCLNDAAENLGLSRGMGFSDARALYPDLKAWPAMPEQDAKFLRVLARWATRYCPWGGLEGGDGLVMDITGSAHLFGGEAAMIDDMHSRLARAGLAVRIGLADTRGAAWALARFSAGISPPGQTMQQIAPLPVAALRITPKLCATLQRLGLETIRDIAALPRASLTRRFGPDLLMRLDQALGDLPEQVSPLPDPPRYAARLTLPDPIGLKGDVMAGLERLLIQTCARLTDRAQGARDLRLTLRRVDQANQQVELRLARPLRDPARILPLFEKGVDAVDAGYGIDQLRLEVTRVQDLPLRQITSAGARHEDALDDLVTRLGSRIGLENIIRFLPADSHIPERSHIIAPAAYSRAEGVWPRPNRRPLRLFPPEHIAANTNREPPRYFRWRRIAMTTARATGPERITPEWWLTDAAWRSGLRDYWHVETRQGWRLWLFHTPQNPAWFVQGVFA